MSLEIEKKIYELAKQQASKKLENNEYKLPDQIYDEDGKFDSKKKFEVLTSRYDDEQIVVNDQEMWE